MYKITGKLKAKLALIHVGEKNWQKQEVVVETVESKYPQVVCLEGFGDVVQEIGMLVEGNTYTFNFGVKGREWVKDGVTKYFTTLSLISIDGVKKESSNFAKDFSSQVASESGIKPEKSLLDEVRAENKDRLDKTKSALKPADFEDDSLPF